MPITHHNTKQRCPCISMDSVLLFENSANRESDLIWTLHSRISGEAAVDGENNAGYEAGLALVAEEQQSTRQILGHAEATPGICLICSSDTVSLVSPNQRKVICILIFPFFFYSSVRSPFSALLYIASRSSTALPPSSESIANGRLFLTAS